MSLEEWNKIQIYIYKKFKIDPKNLKLIVNVASCISCYRKEIFNIELLSEIENVVEKLIKILKERN